MNRRQTEVSLVGNRRARASHSVFEKNAVCETHTAFEKHTVCGKAHRH